MSVYNVTEIGAGPAGLAVVYDVVVIGAGPAGLAAARSAVLACKNKSVVVIDAGPGIDTRRHKFDGTIVGAGGASLCNDGKLSFGTAGTALKWLPPKACTDAKRDLLQLFQLPSDREPVLDEASGFRGDATPVEPNPTYELKRYPTLKTTPEARLEFIIAVQEQLAAAGCGFLWSTLVKDVTWDSDAGVYVVVRAEGAPIAARAIVNASGRLGPIALRAPVTKFRRESVGVRLVMTKGTPDGGVLNPTKVWNTVVEGVPVQFRTFCWCDNGRVIKTDTSALGTKYALVSGTTDPEPDPPLGCTVVAASNVGILARFTAVPPPDLMDAITRYMEQAAVFTCSPDGIAALCDSQLYRIIQHGVTEFTTAHPHLGVTMAVGPCVEGVGWYPNIDPRSQRIQAEAEAGPAYFAAGDGAGLLRGLVPSYVSGWCAGREAAAHVATRRAITRVKARAGFGRETETLLPPSVPEVSDDVAAAFVGDSQQLLLFEVHVFVGPLNPTTEHRALYQDAIDIFNEEMAEVYGDVWKAAKTPFLGLKFKGAGYAHVMQSARYVPAADLHSVVRAVYEQDAAVLAATGLPILRVKVELSMHGSVRAAPDTPLPDSVYSEHHIRVAYVGRRGGVPDRAVEPPPEELSLLEDVASRLQTLLCLPVGLSYNLQRHETPDTKARSFLFLNIRFRGFHDATAALARVDQLKRFVDEHAPSWTVRSPINEWVMHDSQVNMDRGWIDVARNPVIVLGGTRFSGKTALEIALLEVAKDMGVRVHVVRMADATKLKFLETKGLPASALNDRATKEALRDELAAFALHLYETDPGTFLAPVQWALDKADSDIGVVLVPDVRLRDQFDAFAKGVDPRDFTAIKIVAGDEARARRGFIPTPYDSTVFETGLADVTSWSEVWENDGDDLATVTAKARDILFKCCAM